MNRVIRKSGLTLIELVMTISIVGILVSGSMLYIKQVIDLWDFMSFRNEIVSPGMMALTRMSREIRQISNSTSVLNANNTSFRFTDVNNVIIDYYFSSPNLIRNNDTLASGVSNLTLTYYNLTNQPITNPLISPQATDIKRIKIRLEMFSGNQDKTLETQVYPRNLGG
jgi:prepilin-type N-terminal cleavage/methylation domain-containing protein